MLFSWWLSSRSLVMLQSRSQMRLLPSEGLTEPGESVLRWFAQVAAGRRPQYLAGYWQEASIPCPMDLFMGCLGLLQCPLSECPLLDAFILSSSETWHLTASFWGSALNTALSSFVPSVAPSCSFRGWMSKIRCLRVGRGPSCRFQAFHCIISGRRGGLAEFLIHFLPLLQLLWKY